MSRAVCPSCLPPLTGPRLGATPPFTPKPQRPAVKEGKVSPRPWREGRREGQRPPHLWEDLLFQQDKGGRAGQEEQRMEGLHGCEMDAEGLQGQVSQVGP